ncbi:hypothetical protein KVH15_09770 [Streptomyces olivaceus]|uniref:ATP-grasp domain-containing protein n=1 Tax=Streptomyces olivaceus TaxID=47716 RepID=UPI001CCB1527|nr:hypothetical protein [Streptomyces olivaceus]MBZ6081331.1 hypothetical protein [Streptomyces olivaceus]
MKPSVLFINYHSYASFARPGGHALPTAELDLHLVTRTGSHGGLSRFTENPLDHVHVCTPDVLDEWRSVCEWIIERHSIERVVAVHEGAMLLAAELRTTFGLPGMDSATALRVRDKVTMKDAVRQAGAAQVPEYAGLDSADDLMSMDWSTGRKVIKRRRALAAIDLHIVESLEHAQRVCGGLDLSDHDFQIEEFIEGEIYHCDSVVQGGEIVFASVGRYLTNPAAYAPGGVFGTELMGSGELRDRILKLNDGVVRAVGMPDGATHFELFHTPDDDLVFCEIAGRPPGGIIPHVTEAQYGFNIIEAAFRLQAGLDVTLDEAEKRRTDGASGFIAFYPGGAVDRGIPATRHAELEIVEHIHNSRGGNGAGGVRHSSDFYDSYVIRSADRESLMARIDQVKKTYWLTGCGDQKP